MPNLESLIAWQGELEKREKSAEPTLELACISSNNGLCWNHVRFCTVRNMCDYGASIGGVASFLGLGEYPAALPDVVISCYNRCVSLDRGQELMKSIIRKTKLNQVLVCPCSP